MDRLCLKIVLVVLVICFIGGCASAPRQYSFDKKFTVNGAYDEVWAGIIDCLATYNTPIKTIEKSSGIVATDEMKTPYGKSYTSLISDYCDCGSPDFLIHQDKLLATYNFFVKSIGEKETTFQVNARYRVGLWYRNKFIDWIDCESKGYLEQKMQECVRQALISHYIEKAEKTEKIEKKVEKVIPTPTPARHKTELEEYGTIIQSE